MKGFGILSLYAPLFPFLPGGDLASFVFVRGRGTITTTGPETGPGLYPSKLLALSRTTRFLTISVPSQLPNYPVVVRSLTNNYPRSTGI